MEVGSATRIPRFALYGEEMQGAADAGFVHVEDIRSRSRLYNWEIQPHTHRGLFQTVVVLDGGARIQLDDRAVEIAGPHAVVIPPASVHAFQFRPDSHGYVLTVAEAMLFQGAGVQSRPLFEALFLEPAIVDLAHDPETAGRIDALFGHLMAEARWRQPGQALMSEWLVGAVLLMIERQRALSLKPLGTASRTERARAALFARFRALVEEHYAEHWPIPRYADALGVTERQLTRLCRLHGDRSAFEVVQDRLLLEARRRLIYIAAPVSLLAYELGFEDPAYFSRFFKKLTGMTPAAFRRQRGGL
ncbi:helix-turn-helix domain-containing protein [Azospirillum sp. TSO22-1]|uniref:helix-turn-helix domain-containing protein n=1 Tax=Azospirillum sp. TSO22-1 TaxID=716789 RepID=UPI000D607056|nr:helix-turn-helix domain-containing protein [Azospirillum sp. TSO22-1]PWC52478.1 AraC family transcriptional regulator [Azospirillum sp. TSO22-1]